MAKKKKAKKNKALEELDELYAEFKPKRRDKIDFEKTLAVLNNVKLVKFKSAKSIYRSWIKVTGTKLTSDLPGLSFVQMIESDGLWGFADLTTNKIRYWFDKKKVSDSDVAELLGHELGHLVPSYHANDDHEEDRADEFGVVASMVFDLVLKRKPKGKKLLGLF